MINLEECLKGQLVRDLDSADLGGHGDRLMGLNTSSLMKARMALVLSFRIWEMYSMSFLAVTAGEKRT